MSKTDDKKTLYVSFFLIIYFTNELLSEISKDFDFQAGAWLI